MLATNELIIGKSVALFRDAYPCAPLIHILFGIVSDGPHTLVYEEKDLN